MKVGFIIEIVNLPERCDCGGEKGIVSCISIEAPDGKLLMEVRCRGCGKKTLIPDERQEEIRKIVGEKYRPTWYYQPETDEIVHWALRKEKGGE